MITTTVLLLMAALLLVGVPVGFAMGIAGAIGIYWADGYVSMMGVLGSTPYRTSASWLLTAIPLFVLMAELLSSSKVTAMLFNSGNRWLGHLPGGLAIAGVFTAAGLGAVSGSSTASTAAMSRAVTPELLKRGYAPHIAVGTVASAGTLAVMIPPSVVMIVYGILTENSIGDMFIAGVIPGLITALMFAAAIVIQVKLDPSIAPPSERTPMPERLRTLIDIWPMIFLFVLVLGGIYSGLTTVTESAGIGAFGALLLAIFYNGRSAWGSLVEATRRTIVTVAMIFAIVIGAHIFGYFMTLTGTPQRLLQVIGAMDVPPIVVVLALVAIFLIMGCVMDQLAIMVLSIPIAYPLVVGLGYDPIWFGILMIKTVEIGLLTPPLGMNCFVASSISQIPLGTVFRGAMPFLIAELLFLSLLIAVPQIVTAVI